MTDKSPPPMADQSIGGLLKHLSQDMTQLMRQELELAKAEMAQKGRQAGPGLGMLGGAGILALLAAGTFTAFLIMLLAMFMSDPLAALIVTVVYAAIAGVLALTGKNRVQEAAPPVPEQTVETLKEDVQWAKTQVKSGVR